MICEWVDIPGGGVAIVCSRRTRTQKCRTCHQWRAVLLCDHPNPQNGKKGGGTCDKPLCRSCAVRRGPNIDWCPSHVIPAQRRFAWDDP
jgi:hypothetical protein